MAIKIIKFDLPINGTKVTTLEALRDNLTDEIVQLARSGQLERWFKSRQLQEQAVAVAAAVSQHAKDKVLFLALCAVLELEVHPDDASAIFDAPPEAGQHIRDVMEYKQDLEEVLSRYNKILLDILLLIQESFIVEEESLDMDFDVDFDMEPEDEDAAKCAQFLNNRICEFVEKTCSLIKDNSEFECTPIRTNFELLRTEFKSISTYAGVIFFMRRISSHLMKLDMKRVERLNKLFIERLSNK